MSWRPKLMQGTIDTGPWSLLRLTQKGGSGFWVKLGRRQAWAGSKEACRAQTPRKDSPSAKRWGVGLESYVRGRGGM